MSKARPGPLWATLCLRGRRAPMLAGLVVRTLCTPVARGRPGGDGRLTRLIVLGRGQEGLRDPGGSSLLTVSGALIPARRRGRRCLVAESAVSLEAEPRCVSYCLLLGDQVIKEPSL